MHRHWDAGAAPGELAGAGLEVAARLVRATAAVKRFKRVSLRNGNLSAIKRLCRRLDSDCGPRAEDVAIPVETAPGKVAQVDFGYVGKLYDSKARYLRKAYVFVLVLGFSRHMHAQIVFDQSTETWLRLHIDAFEHLGGVPAILAPDNLKAAVTCAAFAADGESAGSIFCGLAHHEIRQAWVVCGRKPRATAWVGLQRHFSAPVTHDLRSPDLPAGRALSHGAISLTTVGWRPHPTCHRSASRHRRPRSRRAENACIARIAVAAALP